MSHTQTVHPCIQEPQNTPKQKTKTKTHEANISHIHQISHIQYNLSTYLEELLHTFALAYICKKAMEMR